MKMTADEIIETIEAYRKKYGIYLSANWGDWVILKKKIGRNTFYMDTGLPTDTYLMMMKTSIEIGTNYLEDSMLAAGKKWEARDPGMPKRGEIF